MPNPTNSNSKNFTIDVAKTTNKAFFVLPHGLQWADLWAESLISCWAASSSSSRDMSQGSAFAQLDGAHSHLVIALLVVSVTGFHAQFGPWLESHPMHFFPILCSLVMFAAHLAVRLLHAPAGAHPTCSIILMGHELSMCSDLQLSLCPLASLRFPLCRLPCRASVALRATFLTALPLLFVPLCKSFCCFRARFLCAPLLPSSASFCVHFFLSRTAPLSRRAVAGS